MPEDMNDMNREEPSRYVRSFYNLINQMRGHPITVIVLLRVCGCAVEGGGCAVKGGGCSCMFHCM